MCVCVFYQKRNDDRKFLVFIKCMYFLHPVLYSQSILHNGERFGAKKLHENLRRKKKQEKEAIREALS